MRYISDARYLTRDTTMEAESLKKPRETNVQLFSHTHKQNEAVEYIALVGKALAYEGATKKERKSLPERQSINIDFFQNITNHLCNLPVTATIQTQSRDKHLKGCAVLGCTKNDTTCGRTVLPSHGTREGKAQAKMVSSVILSLPTFLIIEETR